MITSKKINYDMNYDYSKNLELIEISDKEYNELALLVYEAFGIKFTDKKKILVRARLHKIIKESGFKNFKDYYNSILNDQSKNSLLHLIDKLTTNHSYFFREIDHFYHLENTILPELKRINQQRKELRIWCAGCAAGEEAYSIAMTVKNFFQDEINNWDIGILATDISISVLHHAKQAVYNIERIKDVPNNYKMKYFLIDNKTGKVEITEDIKKMILLKRLNLMRNHFPFKGKFDIIFCRNVMIYFDNEKRNDLILKFHKTLKDHGILFLGHSESLNREMFPFNYVAPSIYKKKL